jgi:hypothetical protein
MPGGPEPAYVDARRVLLDALAALGPHRDAIVLVGAHAIYLHTGEGDLSVAPFTTDGDIAIDPAALAPDPKLEEAMTQAGFVRDLTQPGVWIGDRSIKIDLLVPETLGGRGRRGARLGAHGNRAARKARGLEAALVDRSPMTIEAFEEGDTRRFEIAVAGSAALLVAKLHKIGERGEGTDRLEDKDALDVLRLLRAIPTADLERGLRRVARAELSAEVTREAIAYLAGLFSTAHAPGSTMAARAAAPLEDPETIAASSAALAGDLLSATETLRSS